MQTAETAEDIRDISKEISHDLLLTISEIYLTPLERDFVALIVNKRRTAEIAELLELLPCEVVRRRKIISRKVKVVYTYHYKLDYIEFLRYAVTILPPDRFKCLLLYYVELKTLKEISQILGIKHFTVQRIIHSVRDTLEKEIDFRPDLKECLRSFDDIPYLNIKEINRVKKDARRLYKVQIGEHTLGEWLQKDGSSQQG